MNSLVCKHDCRLVIYQCFSHALITLADHVSNQQIHPPLLRQGSPHTGWFWSLLISCYIKFTTMHFKPFPEQCLLIATVYKCTIHSNARLPTQLMLFTTSQNFWGELCYNVMQYTELFACKLMQSTCVASGPLHVHAIL